MRILIVGAGEVGERIAADLVDSHEVVVIDPDGDRVAELTNRFDLLAIEGDGTSLEMLSKADVEDADIVVAATDDDETNLAVCGTVSTVSDVFTIGQVEKPTYTRTWRHSHGAFGANFLVNAELQAAEAIASIVDFPMAHDLETFADGEVQVVEFEVGEESPITDASLEDLAADELVPVAVIRDQTVHTAGSGVTLQPVDRVIVVGTATAIETFSTDVTPASRAQVVEDVVVLGGTSTAHQVARRFEGQGRSPRMVVADRDRAHRLADDLPETTILVHDATDPDFLERENIGDADVAVVAFESDQQGLLTSMLARQEGVDRTVTIVAAAKYDKLFEAAGVDVAVHPRAEAAEEISRFTRGRRAENVAIVERDVAEVFEIEVEAESLLIDHTVNEAENSLPEGVTVGAIVRDGAYLSPRPSAEFQEDDRVVVFSPAAVSDETLGQL